MHFVSEMSNLIANFIDLLACGVQLHRDDHGCPLCRRIFLCGEILSRDFFPPQNVSAKPARNCFAENKKPTRLRVGRNFFLLLRLQIRPSPPI
jgi:hypothetical protein